MIQFYALSIFANLLAGFAIAVQPGEGEGFVVRLRGLLEDGTFKFVLGLTAAVVGFFKLLSPAQGDLIVIGDLLPAAAGLAAGGVLLFDFFRGSSSLSSTTVDRIESRIRPYRTAVGYAAMAAAGLHFLLPTVPVF